VDLWAASESYRYGIFVPDEDPPGNQVTTRVQKFQLLSHSLQRFALMLTPRSIPGEVVSPRILRHAPSCYIPVTMRAADLVGVGAFSGVFRGLKSHPKRVTPTVRRLSLALRQQSGMLIWNKLKHITV
jgi:hypothetical protein